MKNTDGLFGIRFFELELFFEHELYFLNTDFLNLNNTIFFD